MIDEIQGSDAIDSKAVSFSDPDDGTEVPMILTAFDEEDNEVLDDAGYRGRDVLITLIDGGVHESQTDPYRFEHHIVEGHVKGFIVDVVRGWKTYGREGIDWSDLEHGESYEKGEVNQYHD